MVSVGPTENSMQTARELLEQSVSSVVHEQACLRAECEGFREFRDVVSRVGTTSTDGSEITETERLLEAYRETVMASPEFDSAYGESLVESLENEFSHSITHRLLEDDGVTQRFKRKLLVATNAAIERRRQFCDTLDVERKSLRTTREAITDIERTLQATPACSLQTLPFDEFADVWSTCDALVDRCERLSQERQSAIGDRQDDAGPRGDVHALNEYLYGDMATTYPALHAIARTRQIIERYRRGTEAGRQNDRSQTIHH